MGVLRLLLGYHDLYNTQTTTKRVIWTLTTFSTHQRHNLRQKGMVVVLGHSTRLFAMYQGLQGLQTWAWTKSKGLLRHWHLLNPQRLLKEHQDTLTHTCWHQWQSSQHIIYLTHCKLTRLGIKYYHATFLPFLASLKWCGPLGVFLLWFYGEMPEF